jgi:carbamoyltransferase
MKYILGIQTGHDAAAALIVDGKIVADAAEERFTRVKNDCSFPLNAIAFCLNYAGIKSEDLDAIALPHNYLPPSVRLFFDIPKNRLPTLKSRLKQTILQYAPISKKTDTILPLYQRPLKVSPKCKIILIGHHKAHAGSAYYTSGLYDERALVVTMDGIGDSSSITIWKGQANKLERLKSWGGEASLGWFYSNCTEALGWRHGSDEWKTMGLAPYGKTHPGALDGFYPVFKSGELIKPHKYVNGGTWLDHSAYHYHFDDAYDLEKIAKRLGREDFAAEAQRVFQEQVNEIILPWLKKMNTRHLCAAGGAFLNVKSNQEIWYSGELDTQWIYPNPGDAGLAAGAALCVYFENHPKHKHQLLPDVYFGPEFSNAEIKRTLDERGLEYEYTDSPSLTAAEYLADNKIIGWFQGRMESGPRALGSRSILMSPLKEENKDIINRCVKYREAFRPFCPSMLYEKSDEYLINSRDERFMVTSFAVREEKRNKIPAVVHVDGTARPQMVKKESNPRYYELIKAFGDKTGEYVILNTSFNVKGEPIVCSPREAIRCFFDTGLDVLILGNYKILKPRSPQT